MKIYGHLLLLKFNKKMRLSEFGDGRWGKSLVGWILVGWILVTGCSILDAAY